MNPDTMWAIYYAIYPLFMLMAAGGVENAMRSINDVYTNTVVIGLIALFSILPIRHIAFNQPLSFIYFNELSGGIHNAYAKYTIQYDSESNKLSAQWLKEHIRANNWSGDPDHVWQVATNGNQACNLFFEHDSTITLEHMPYHATDTTWDYYISFCNDVPATLLRNGLWPPDSAIMIFRLENLPVTAIYMNKHREQQRSLLDSIAQAQCDSLLNVGDNLHDD